MTGEYGSISRNLSLALITESGVTTLKWDPEERRIVVGALVAETIWKERDDTGLRKTIEGEVAISTAWYLTKKTASIDTPLMILAAAGVVGDTHARVRQIVIDQVTTVKDQRDRKTVANIVGAVAALITSIVTRTRILVAIVDTLFL